MAKKKKDKIITIIGTTASGKTSLAVRLARKYKGEIVSADSRQVYRYLDIGSGKDLPEYGEIAHHLIDVAEPKEEYDLAKWLPAAKTAIRDIIGRGKIPIIAGGTGLYTQALLDGYKLSSASNNDKLREALELLPLAEVQEKLKKISPEIFAELNNSEVNNKRRLIRRIEILLSSEPKTPSLALEKPYDSLIIGLHWPKELLRARIMKRIIDRLENQAMIEEVAFLHNEYGLSWSRLESFGLEYRHIAQFLQGQTSRTDMIKKLHEATCRFAKRQLTWYRRWEGQGAKIHWLENFDEADLMLKNFLNPKN